MKIASIIISCSILILFSACAEEVAADEVTKQVEKTNSAIEENMKLIEQNNYRRKNRDTSTRTDWTFHDTVKK